MSTTAPEPPQVPRLGGSFKGRHQVPLLGRRHQTYVTVGGDACPMENHLHGRVLLIYENGMVGAVVEKKR
jgi:hypothetical protein